MKPILAILKHRSPEYCKQDKAIAYYSNYRSPARPRLDTSKQPQNAFRPIANTALPCHIPTPSASVPHKHSTVLQLYCRYFCIHPNKAKLEGRLGEADLKLSEKQSQDSPTASSNRSGALVRSSGTFQQPSLSAPGAPEHSPLSSTACHSLHIHPTMAMQSDHQQYDERTWQHQSRHGWHNGHAGPLLTRAGAFLSCHYTAYEIWLTFP